MSRCLIVDSNNQIARYTNVYDQAVTSEGLHCGGLYGMLEGVRKFLVQNPDHTSVIFVIDKGVPAFRTQLCEEYKAQRAGKRTPEQELIFKAYKEQVPHVRRVTRWLGCGFASADNWEGDDLAASIAIRRCADRGVTIYASDKDYTSLITTDGRVKVYDGISANWRDADQNYFWERILDPKASDNLDGVPGVGPVAAKLIIDEWRLAWEATHSPEAQWPTFGKAGMTDFLNWCEYVKDGATEDKHAIKIKKIAAKVHAKAEKCWANYKVTCMRRVSKRVDEAMVFKCHAPDFTKFRDTAKEYGLRPVLEEFGSYKLVFGRLDHSFLTEAQHA